MFLTAKTAQALKHVVSALQLDPGHEPAMRLRKRVKDVDRLKDEGNVAFKAGQLQTANEKYTEALDVRGHQLLEIELRAYRAFCSESAVKRAKARVATYVLCYSPTEPQRFSRYTIRKYYQTTG